MTAYRALAQTLKGKIAAGEYAVDVRLPSEAAIGREYGLSIMTVRQAIGLLVQEGLLKRVQGSGTFVATPTWAQASFGLTGLANLMEDRENISMSFLKACLASAGPKTAAHLQLDP
ncbi:MAG: GntR family transcriptional regulator, partial [Deltaproteobacteria bacterium]|nr:GntR family transcriptional regulator [Deltaproteobacteria bacterium]